ncbi:Na(+)/citrate cotransporter-like [Haemaphysalis longicornis]
MPPAAEQPHRPSVVVVGARDLERVSSAWHTQRMLLGYVAPFMLAPLLVLKAQISKCVYMVLLMAMMWLSVVIPPQATALLPLVVLPVLGIASAKKVGSMYYGDGVITLICSAAFAVTMDRSRVLRRVSLLLLGWSGFVYRPLALSVLFAVFTALLAALARPTLAVTVMSAAARALILELQRATMLKYSRPSDGTAGGEDPRTEKEDPEIRLLMTDFSIQLRALLLLVSFSSHLGSSLLPSGHEALIHLKRALDSHMDEKTAPSALFWFAVNGPCVVVLLALNVAYIYLVYLRPLAWEGIMLFFFLIFVMALFTREPGFFPGWSSFLGVQKDVRDASPTVLVFLLLAFIPVQSLEMTSKDRALHWKFVLPHIPWGLGLVLASGNAIAYASTKCGLRDALLEWGPRGSSAFLNQALLMVGAAINAQMSIEHTDNSRVHKLFEKVSSACELWPV